MARWDPGTEDRLKRAALELFAEHGYDDVTVAQIAERAGITRRSYFRYFPDKREVLFGGSELLPPAIREAVLAADPAASPMAAVIGAMRQVGATLAERADQSAERRAVIESSPELKERERTKFAAVTSAIAEALRLRGAENAELLARLAAVAFGAAFERWIEAGGEKDFGSCLDVVVSSLRGALADD